MPRAALAGLLLLAGGCTARAPAVPARAAAPRRVMSLNLCTDQLVLALLPPERIASVSWLARDPASSLMAAAAARVPVNRGRAEEVLRQRPDLVIAGAYTTPALRAMLRRLGYPLLEVRNADSVAQVRIATRTVAAAVGEPARGAALLGAMDRRLAQLARRPPRRVRVAAWDRDGFGAGPGTLYGAIMDAAGGENVGHGPQAARLRRPDVEALLAVRPALLVEGGAATAAPSLGDDVSRHRLVRRLWGHDRTVAMPQASYACGTPLVAEAVSALARQLDAAGRAR